jgi:imidazolonepropionase-like amidohydrolase
MNAKELIGTLLTALLLASAPVAIAQEQEAEPQILITNVNVWDGTSSSLQNGMNVLITGNLIASVSSGRPAAVGATVIDGGGRTLMPGLIDMHSHLCIADGMLFFRDAYDQMAAGAAAAHAMLEYLDQGFTTARDTGCNILGIAKGVNNGIFPGPRLFPSGGFISQTGGHGDTGYFNAELGELDPLAKAGFSHIVDGPDEITKAVRHNLRAGATQIKVMAGGGVASEFDPLHMTQYSLEEMKAAVDAAANYGTYVLVHAYHDSSVNRAIDAGARVIEHNFLVSEETIMRMKREGVALSVQAVVALVHFGDPDSVPFFSADQKAKAKRVNAGALQMMQWAIKHDLIMVTGGDMFGPDLPNQADNIIKFNEVAQDPLKVLKTATSNAAVVLAWSGEMNPYKEAYPNLDVDARAQKGIGLGVVEKGAYADVILIDGNPLEDITRIKRDHVHLVIKDGTVYKNEL